MKETQASAFEGTPGHRRAPKTVGDLLSDIQFPASEYKRIAALAERKASLPRQILKTYATGTKPYREYFVKIERIAGARPGTQLYRTQSPDRIVENMSAVKNERFKLAWGIYRNSVTDYVENELPKLDKLLRGLRITAPDMTATEALKVVCENADDYDVPVGDIQRFYEVWGLPRIDNFETVLGEWMKPDELAQQGRRLERARAELRSLAEVAEALGAEVASLKVLSSDGSRHAAEVIRTQQRLDEAQRALADSLSALATRFETGDRRLKAVEDSLKAHNELLSFVQRESVTMAALMAESVRLEAVMRLEVASTIDASRSAMERVLRDECVSVRERLELEIAELSARVPLVADGRGRTGSRAPLPLSTRPPPAKLGSGLRWATGTRPLTSKGELLRALAASFRARGVSPAAAIRLHAAVMANVMPVLVGAASTAALEAYAEATCGGRLVKVHVTPTLIEPADLFGRLDPVRQVYRPHSSQILDAVLATQEFGTALAVLEGINRGPTESYLVPLLAHRGPIQLFHGASPSANDVPSTIELPRGLRLAASSVVGPTSLPMSPDLWTHAIAIEVLPLEGGPAATTSSPSEWATDAKLPEVDVPSALLSSLFAACADARDSLPAMIRFARSFASMSGNEDDLIRAIVEGFILPTLSGLASSEEDRRTAITAVAEATGSIGADDLVAIERRLRRSLA